MDFIHFDFEEPVTFDGATKACDVLFLLRPPQLADVDRYFKPLVDSAVRNKVQHVVFLSVQGAPDSSFIPHHKIEKLIEESELPFTFLRPAYFMQNFKTTLHGELTKNRRIFLPAGDAEFTLIDVRDIGAVAARVLSNPDQYANRGMDLTTEHRLTFGEMAEQLSEGLGEKITFESPSLLRFFWIKKKEGTPTGYILVLILLHYFPRFQKKPPLSDAVRQVLGRAPITFRQYVRDYAAELV